MLNGGDSMRKYDLKNRDLYLNKLKVFQDTEPVKVVTGIRRCGKSSLLKLMVNYLLESGVHEEQIIEMNFESYVYRKMNADDFYHYVSQLIIPHQKMYLFFDELQRITGWEDVVNSFRVDFNCDIYITGSNAYLLSSQYSTYLSGRYVEIKMLPLSFQEFIDFHGFTIKETINALGNKKRYVYDSKGDRYELNELFQAYMRYGGMPGIADVGLEQERVLTLLDGIYSTVIVRDILERETLKSQRKMTDSVLLRKIIMFLADNIGSSISISKIGNVLMDEGLLEKERKTKPSHHTVQAYVNALLEAYFLYEIKRFDIKGKEYLRTLGKFYIVDIGLRNYLLGYRNRDTGHVLENIVYFELLKRGYDIAVGKINQLEIDFIATKADEKLYVQVTESMISESVRKRELTPLEKVNDNYEKIILSLDNETMSYNGIKLYNIMDWLIE